MFLVKDEPYGARFFVFTWEDPRKGGYRGEVTPNVTLDYDMEAVHVWPDGAERPEACLGQAPDNPKHYKVFKYSRDLREAGYQPVPATAIVSGSWPEYVRMHLIPPDPEQTEDESWYDYLDKLDDAARRRRQRVQGKDRPEGPARDQVAAWVARRHFITDSGIREVWYLPRGAPAEEIRFLEVNDRLMKNGNGVEAIDFGLDIEGVRFVLFVADVTSEQLQKIKEDPRRLPKGWVLDGNVVWGRRK